MKQPAQLEHLAQAIVDVCLGLEIGVELVGLLVEESHGPHQSEKRSDQSHPDEVEAELVPFSALAARMIHCGCELFDSSLIGDCHSLINRHVGISVSPPNFLSEGVLLP